MDRLIKDGSAVVVLVTLLCHTGCNPEAAVRKTLAEGNTHVLAADLFSVTFPTEETGWACGRWGTILHTKDGGRTWAPQRSSTDYTLASIFFTDSQNGWAVGDGGTILRTVDGGASWVEQECPVSQFLNEVVFVNPQRGWTVGERTTILHTEDGGDHWEIQFSDEDFILKSISFFDPQTGWAAGEYGYIFHTKDGGWSWSKQAGEFAFTESMADVVGGNYLFDVFAKDPTTAWVVGIDGYVAKTTDAGENWEDVQGDFPSTQLFTVASNSAGTMVIGGAGTLMVSRDRGRTFFVPEIRPGITYGWIYGACRRGKAGFAAAGKEGAIYLSDADGASWLKAH
jgi:photosystem II stability/assembly factor-like uncharacterized protein